VISFDKNIEALEHEPSQLVNSLVIRQPTTTFAHINNNNTNCSMTALLTPSDCCC